jgi:hypothetical protein
VHTWPCDEINYIWRHGNLRFPSDEFLPDMARPDVTQFVRRQFERLARSTDARAVVEKTCANSLRVGFVDRILPEARYLFIHRDGLDAVGSAMQRWAAPLDLPYLLRKVRYVPVSDLPYYGGRYLWNRIYRLFSTEKRLAFWGPQLDDMPGLLLRHPLDEVCALQWKRCVDAAHSQLSALPADRWLDIGYEDLVTQPEAQLRRIVEFLGIDAVSDDIAKAVVGVSGSSIGKGRSQLGEAAMARLEPLIQGTQRRHGYA